MHVKAIGHANSTAAFKGLGVIALCEGSPPSLLSYNPIDQCEILVRSSAGSASALVATSWIYYRFLESCRSLLRLQKLPPVWRSPRLLQGISLSGRPEVRRSWSLILTTRRRYSC